MILRLERPSPDQRATHTLMPGSTTVQTAPVHTIPRLWWLFEAPQAGAGAYCLRSPAGKAASELKVRTRKAVLADDWLRTTPNYLLGR